MWQFLLTNVAHADQYFDDCLVTFASSTVTDCVFWNEASSTALTNSTIFDLSSALYNILVIIIPVAVAVGIFFFAYNWVRGIFHNRR